MSGNTRSLLNSAGRALLFLLGVNVVAAGIGWIITEPLEVFAIHQGVVELNGQAWGFPFRSFWGKTILLLVFFWNLWIYYQRSKLSLYKQAGDERN